MGSLKGQLLIAPPSLSEPNFTQTIVLMIDHDEDGALGVVINRPTELKLKSFWEHLGCNDIHDCTSQRTLWLGGPVEGYVLSLHNHPDFSEMELIEGVYLAAIPDRLKQLVQDDQHEVRVFWGYAGWGAGQLESELDVGGWLTAQASIDMVFHDGREELWKEAVYRSGETVLRSALKIHSFPVDPRCN